MVAVKALGFCVSKAHAVYMNDFFNQHGVSALCITADTPSADRHAAKKLLASGAVKIIFAVDIYNEGVDIPAVNTVLFLRPTESLTVFLQQLGRGLRLFQDKDCLTVLDFVGQANKLYRYADRFSALLTNSSMNIEREVKNGFWHLPKGCYIQLEKKASEYILENIKATYSGKRGIIARIVDFVCEENLPLTMSDFLNYSNADERDIYWHDSFSRLCVEAGVRQEFHEQDAVFKNLFQRIIAINSRRWIAYLLKALLEIRTLTAEQTSQLEKDYLLMFYYTAFEQPAGETFHCVLDKIASLQENTTLFAELLELLAYRLDSIDFVDKPVDFTFNCALDLHCDYTSAQILTALGNNTASKKPAMREGVKYFSNKKLDVFFITLNKSEKEYSVTTCYDDYSINDEMFHWQSQSTVSDTSPTGQRYIHQRDTGNSVALFVREYKKDGPLTALYTFIGLADYVSHSGNRPMSITWKLHDPIPAKFLRITNKLIVA